MTMAKRDVGPTEAAFEGKVLRWATALVATAYDARRGAAQQIAANPHLGLTVAKRADSLARHMLVEAALGRLVDDTLADDDGLTMVERLTVIRQDLLRSIEAQWSDEPGRGVGGVTGLAVADLTEFIEQAPTE